MVAVTKWTTVVVVTDWVWEDAGAVKAIPCSSDHSDAVDVGSGDGADTAVTWLGWDFRFSPLKQIGVETRHANNRPNVALLQPKSEVQQKSAGADPEACRADTSGQTDPGACSLDASGQGGSGDLQNGCIR